MKPKKEEFKQMKTRIITRQMKKSLQHVDSVERVSPETFQMRFEEESDIASDMNFNLTEEDGAPLLEYNVDGAFTPARMIALQKMFSYTEKKFDRRFGEVIKEIREIKERLTELTSMFHTLIAQLGK